MLWDEVRGICSLGLKTNLRSNHACLLVRFCNLDANCSADYDVEGQTWMTCRQTKP